MRRAAGPVLALIAWGGLTAAQDESPVPAPADPVIPPIEAEDRTIILQSQILTVDIERLFAGSAFGQRIATQLLAEQEALAEENRRIADALREEELDLAARRPEMDPEVFRAEAEAFDAKVVEIRAAQDTKERALQQTLTNARELFFDASRPVLGQLMLDSGASVILDRRSVLVSLNAIDVTDEAIARIDAAIGDGSPPEQAPPDELPQEDMTDDSAPSGD